MNLNSTIHKRAIRITIIGIALFLFASNYHYSRWNSMVSGGGDSWGYYVYLPSLFIHHDLHDLQKTLAIRNEKYSPGSVRKKGDILYESENQLHNGTPITKYTSGIAIMHTPAFLLSHFLAQLTKYDKDGFSKPYILGLYISTILYILWGLYLLALILAQRFPIHSVITTLVLLVVCTNLYYFSSYNNVMSHPMTFFLFAALIYLTDRFYKSFQLKTIFLIGLVTGLITLVRPTNIICLLIPLLWGIENIPSRFETIKKHASKLPLAILGFFLAAVPQMLYWKYTTGEFIYYSYQGEGFDFANAMIGRGLFSFRNGWLIYTPIMLAVFPGLYFLYKHKNHEAFWPVILLFPLHVYIIYSWWNWYYINGLGSRPMVDIYPLLAFPLAAFISTVFSNRLLRNTFIAGAFLLSSLNIFQLYQHSKGILWTEDANRAYYFQSLGALKWNQKIAVAYDLATYQPKSYTNKRRLYRDDFTSYNNFIVEQTRRDGRASVLLTQESVDSLASFEISMRELNLDKDEFLSIRLWMRVEKQMISYYDFSNITIDYLRSGELYRRSYLRLHNKPCPEATCSLWYGEVHVWDELIAHIKMFEDAEEDDIIKFAFHTADSSTPLFLSNLEIWVSE